MIPKFRAYWKKGKLMTDVDTIQFLEEGIKVVKTLSDGYHEEFLHNKRVKLMQSTGLTDKNGVEIFEGDIVKFSDPREEFSYTGLVSTIDTGSYWYIKAITPELDPDLSLPGEELNLFFEDVRNENNVCNLDVLGNVFENPELPEILKIKEENNN